MQLVYFSQPCMLADENWRVSAGCALHEGFYLGSGRVYQSLGQWHSSNTFYNMKTNTDGTREGPLREKIM